MPVSDEARVRCSHCGCLVDRQRHICPFCGTYMPQTQRIVRQNESTSSNSFERKISKGMRRADTQRSLIIILLAGIFAMELLLLIVMLFR